MTSLVDELTQKQAPKFQLNGLDMKFIQNTLPKNSEGIFNLDSKTDENLRENIMIFLKANYKGYNFELNYDSINYEIMFRKKRGEKN
jgi:hypothetical protein